MSNRFVNFTEPLYWEAYGFLIREAELLDQNDFRTWLETCLSEDLEYRMPVRTTHENAFKVHFSKTSFHFDESYKSMALRVRKMETEYAWSEDPASRTRRFVTNIRVSQINENQLEVKSYMLITRSRLDLTDAQFLSMERVDVLEKSGDSWKLRKRDIYADATIIGMKNLAIFL